MAGPSWRGKGWGRQQLLSGRERQVEGRREPHREPAKLADGLGDRAAGSRGGRTGHPLKAERPASAPPSERPGRAALVASS